VGKRDDEKPAVDLSPHLVRKALAINPELRDDGKSTFEVLESLRQQAMAQSADEQPGQERGPTPEEQAREARERRREAISSFFQQKAAEHGAGAADIGARERELAREKRELQRRIVDEIVEFLAQVGECPESRQVVQQHRNLLTALGISDQELFARARRKR
jgi:hypothetical protein